MSYIRLSLDAAEWLQSALVGILMPRREDGTQTLRPRRFFVGSGTSLLVVVLLFACYVLGELPGDALVEVTAAVVAGLIGFYLVFRTGLNRAAADPTLMVHQMVYATLVVMYAMYFTTADGVGVFPIIVLIVFLFAVLRLRTRSLLLFALFILTVDAATITLDAFFRPDAPGVHERLLQWVTLALTLPWFAMMGGYVSGLREELRKSNVLLRTALEATQQSESSLAEAQRIAGLGSWSFDPVTRVAHWSLETYAIFGIDPAHPVPMRDAFLRLVHRDDQGQYCEAIVTAIDEGRPFDIEYRIVLSDGEIRWVHVVGEPEVDDNGRTTLLSGTAVDITAYKAQESAIKQARDEATAARTTLSDAIKVLPEAFALFDADDRLALWNSRHAEILADTCKLEAVAGLKYEDQVRASVANGELIPPEFAGDIDAYVADRVRVHRTPSHTREVKVGGGRWLKVSEGHTSNGGIVGVRQDITERKHLEQRQAMEHAVTRLLAESETVGETMPKVIRTLCETLGWDYGARWQLDTRDNRLHCVDSWSVSEREIAAFSAYCARQNFAPGPSGLICRVMTTGVPLWIADVSREPGFKRAAAAETARLRGAFAFPIRVGSELAGAMEFFTRTVRQPDAALLRVLDSIGLQIGQFIARAAAQEELKHRAHYDHLTGLPNRNLFNELLNRAVGKARRNGTRLAVLFIDLDGFKAVNDRNGHDAGDYLLATFSKRLKACLRESDTIARHSASNTAARLGGDEFVVLVDDVVEPTDLKSLAERILNAAAKPFDLAGKQGRVSASLGIAVYPRDGDGIDSLIKAADSAMYDAKQGGRNAYRFFSSMTHQEVCPVS
jgi:diguanylate cyclase (GGDEF)-like protein/PAS domain S-box-containing protein